MALPVAEQPLSSSPDPPADQQLLSPADGRRQRRQPRVPGRCSSVPRVPRGTGRGVTASVSAPGAPWPRGRAQLAHGARPGHPRHLWGTKRGLWRFGGEVKGGHHAPSPHLQPTAEQKRRQRSRKGDKGGSPGAIATPTLLPSQRPALGHSWGPPSQQRCSEPELELLLQHSHRGSPKWPSRQQNKASSRARLVLGCAGLGTDPSPITPRVSRHRQPHPFGDTPGHPWWRGPTFLSPLLSRSRWPRFPGRVWGDLTSRGAGLVRGCRGCRGCRGSAASGSGCSETSCKARRAGAVSAGDGWRWWPLGGTVPRVWRGPGAQSGGDTGWGRSGSRVRQSRRGRAEHSRDTAGSEAVAGKAKPAGGLALSRRCHREGPGL